MYDTAIIGTGPAGISAALTLAALNKEIIWFGTALLSEKIRKAERIRNYPGLAAVTGGEMAAAFSSQIREMGISITEKTVTGVYHMGESYSILCDQEVFEAKTVILATGVEPVKPILGELEFLGRGVSYCATCDGFLYRGKRIAVVCTNKEFEHEIEFLADIAGEVTLIPLYRNPEVERENVRLIKTMPRAVEGQRKVGHLVLPEETLEVDGVFFLKSAISPAALVSGLETREGHVVTERDCATNLPGLFAAGDCTGRPYQYAKAVGEGNIAAHSAVGFLSR